MKRLIARSTVSIGAPASSVWQALTDPDAVKYYMFGTTVRSDWKEGSKIMWKGEWKGKDYEDKGTIQKVVTGKLLQYDHFSPLSGMPDLPENHHTVKITLQETDGTTLLQLEQDNNATDEARQHSEDNWKMMLAKLKEYVERDR